MVAGIKRKKAGLLLVFYQTGGAGFFFLGNLSLSCLLSEILQFENYHLVEPTTKYEIRNQISHYWFLIFFCFGSQIFFASLWCFKIRGLPGINRNRSEAVFEEVFINIDIDIREVLKKKRL